MNLFNSLCIFVHNMVFLEDSLWHQISVIFHMDAYSDYTFVHLLRQNESELYSGCALCYITLGGRAEKLTKSMVK